MSDFRHKHIGCVSSAAEACPPVFVTMICLLPRQAVRALPTFPNPGEDKMEPLHRCFRRRKWKTVCVDRLRKSDKLYADKG